MFTVDGRVFGRDSTEPRMPTCFHSRSGATLRGMAIDAVEVHQYYEQGAYLGSGQVPVLDTSIPPWFWIASGQFTIWLLCTYPSGELIYPTLSLSIDPFSKISMVSNFF